MYACTYVDTHQHIYVMESQVNKSNPYSEPFSGSSAPQTLCIRL